MVSSCCSAEEITLVKEVPQEDTRNLSPPDLPFPENLIGWRCIVAASLAQELNSKTVVAGQAIDCVLQEDFVFGTTKIASKGSVVHGHLINHEQPRTLSKAIVSSDRRYKSDACLGIEFDDIVDSATNQILPIKGTLCKQKIVSDDLKHKRHEIDVDSQGRIIKAERTFSTEKKTTFGVLRAATILPLPGGLAVNLAGGPLIMGTAGAISPSFAYNKPIDDDMPHKRVKGFTYGFITSLPGAFLVQAFVEKGDEVVVQPSDQLALDISLLDPRAQKLASTDVSGRLYPVNPEVNVTRLFPVETQYPINP